MTKLQLFSRLLFVGQMILLVAYAYSKSLPESNLLLVEMYTGPIMLVMIGLSALAQYFDGADINLGIARISAADVTARRIFSLVATASLIYGMYLLF